MAYRQLHTYPKSFNDQANLKTFPFRRPLKMHYWNVGVISVGLFFLAQSYKQWTKLRFTQSDFFKKDKTQLQLRKRSFDTLILTNNLQSSNQIKRRSIF